MQQCCLWVFGEGSGALCHGIGEKVESQRAPRTRRSLIPEAYLDPARMKNKPEWMWSRGKGYGSSATRQRISFQPRRLWLFFPPRTRRRRRVTPSNQIRWFQILMSSFLPCHPFVPSSSIPEPSLSSWRHLLLHYPHCIRPSITRRAHSGRIHHSRWRSNQPLGDLRAPSAPLH